MMRRENFSRLLKFFEGQASNDNESKPNRNKPTTDNAAAVVVKNREKEATVTQDTTKFQENSARTPIENSKYDVRVPVLEDQGKNIQEEVHHKMDHEEVQKENEVEPRDERIRVEISDKEVSDYQDQEVVTNILGDKVEYIEEQSYVINEQENSDKIDEVKLFLDSIKVEFCDIHENISTIRDLKELMKLNEALSNWAELLNRASIALYGKDKEDSEIGVIFQTMAKVEKYMDLFGNLEAFNVHSKKLLELRRKIRLQINENVDNCKKRKKYEQALDCVDKLIKKLYQ